MELKTAEFLKDQIENIGESCEIHEDYSGRGMFGNTTTGIVVENVSHVMRALAEFAKSNSGLELTEEEFVALDDIAGGFRSDSMAMDTILY